MFSWSILRCLTYRNISSFRRDGRAGVNHLVVMSEFLWQGVFRISDCISLIWNLLKTEEDAKTYRQVDFVFHVISVLVQLVDELFVGSNLLLERRNLLFRFWKSFLLILSSLSDFTAEVNGATANAYIFDNIKKYSMSTYRKAKSLQPAPSELFKWVWSDNLFINMLLF